MVKEVRSLICYKFRMFQTQTTEGRSNEVDMVGFGHLLSVAPPAFFWLRRAARGILVPRQGTVLRTQAPCSEKHGVLTTGQPGNSQHPF